MPKFRKKPLTIEANAMGRFQILNRGDMSLGQRWPAASALASVVCMVGANLVRR